MFFLIGCPDDRMHLHTLARLCLMAQKTDLLSELRQAVDGAAMCESILAAERAVLAKANEIASKLADGKHVFYMDVNYLFLRPDGGILATLMPDFEHPSREGHRVWAAATESKIAELMGVTPTAEMPAQAEVKREAAPKH